MPLSQVATTGQLDLAHVTTLSTETIKPPITLTFVVYDPNGPDASVLAAIGELCDFITESIPVYLASNPVVNILGTPNLTYNTPPGIPPSSIVTGVGIILFSIWGGSFYLGLDSFPSLSMLSSNLTTKSVAVPMPRGYCLSILWQFAPGTAPAQSSIHVGAPNCPPVDVVNLPEYQGVKNGDQFSVSMNDQSPPYWDPDSYWLYLPDGVGIDTSHYSGFTYYQWSNKQNMWSCSDDSGDLLLGVPNVQVSIQTSTAQQPSSWIDVGSIGWQQIPIAQWVVILWNSLLSPPMLGGGTYGLLNDPMKSYGLSLDGPFILCCVPYSHWVTPSLWLPTRGFNYGLSFILMHEWYHGLTDWLNTLSGSTLLVSPDTFPNSADRNYYKAQLAKLDPLQWDLLRVARAAVSSISYYNPNTNALQDAPPDNVLGGQNVGADITIWNIGPKRQIMQTMPCLSVGNDPSVTPFYGQAKIVNPGEAYYESWRWPAALKGKQFVQWNVLADRVWKL